MVLEEREMWVYVDDSDRYRIVGAFRCGDCKQYIHTGTDEMVGVVTAFGIHIREDGHNRRARLEALVRQKIR